MENTTNQETPQNESPNLKETIWSQLEFNGKEFCKLDESGNLSLLASAHYPERILSTVTATNAQTVVNALTEKFKEVLAKADELKQEFAQQPEVVKLQGKVQRLKSYLMNANAVGDYQPLFQFIETKETEIAEQLKSNEAQRRQLVEKAMTLKDSEDWKATTEAYRQLIEEWKQAPHVEKEINDKFWEQIEQARNTFYEKKRAHQEDVEKDMMQNLDLKMEICEQAEALSNSEDWKSSSEVYKQLMERWKTIGRVATVDKNEELWSRFLNAKNNFFDRKALHQGQILVEQEGNYEAKLKLVEQAESLKESVDWKETSATYATILEEWKAIGKVPFEKADELWNRMQAAKDHFFNAKRQHTEEFKVGLEDNYAQKKALVDRIETIKHSTNWRDVTTEVNELMATWKTIGPIPREYGDSLWEQFISARQHFFKRKDEDRDARKNRFVQQIQNRLVQSKSFLATIEEELQEEESKWTEFTEILAQTGEEDAKDAEIKQNLKNLVAQIEKRLPGRKAKIEEVKAQIAELEQKINENDHKES
ncbi:hypothetical protein DBR32_03485 [Taibaiella sp. KBW10]|uniref:DUF349 domain-containing protein n=1 Tax=Taibaiella sp. KBW10 TaxID=2153357 RepID=UPI000F59A4BF|nr:DUF349 domain-containing protein [Taibaiella sp. KBW10]RQO31880.1 hypothetical protein DBR32_03485 [Taibaiella sp. KBW10]